MLNHPPNWVAERAECKIDLLYDALCQVVERDVAEANKLPPDLGGGFTYSVERNDEGIMPLLRVYRSREGKPAGPTQPVANFSQSQVSIRVTAETGNFLARLEWVDQTRSCFLSIDGTRYKVWELSQRVLGPIFFSGSVWQSVHSKATGDAGERSPSQDSDRRSPGAGLQIDSA